MDAGGQPVTGDAGFTDPRWEYPEYPPGSVVELRVHGVGGEPPAGMARDPHPRLVGGSKLAGFWRSRNPVAGALEGASQHVREILAWGGQTSGTLRHAFWVLLLPFALFNLAGRMHGDDPDTTRAAVHRGACRLLAYTMTLTIVALIAGAGIDLVGVQCAAVEGCLEAGRTGSFLLAPVRAYAGDPAARLALLALLPLVAVLVLWWAGRYQTTELEGLEDPGAPRAAEGEPVRLQDASFWRNAWPTSRLRSIHASGAFAFLGMILAAVALDLAPPGQWAAWRAALALAGLAVVAGGVLVALPVTVRPGRRRWLGHAQWLLRLGAVVPGTVVLTAALVPGVVGGPGAWLVRAAGLGLVAWWVADEARPPGAAADGPDVTVLGNLRLVAGTALVAATLGAAITGLDHAAAAEVGRLPAGLADWLPRRWIDYAPGLYVAPYLVLVPLVVAQMLLVAVVGATSVQREPLTRREAFQLDGRAFPANLGAVIVALVALLVLTAAGGSLHALLLDWLGDRLAAGPDIARQVRIVEAAAGAPPLVLPWWYALTAMVTAVGLPVLLALAWAGRSVARRWVGRFRVARPDAATVAAELERGVDAATPDAARPDPDDPTAAARLRAIGRQWVGGGLTQLVVRDAPWTLTAAVVAATILVGTVLAGVAGDPAPWIRRVTDLPLLTAAIWVMASLLGGAVGLIRAGLSARSTRRQVGALWDVLTFWPRVTHPFAPPCYGEAIVPMLSHRIRQLTDHDAGYRVVLAGHSQGSVVALAASVVRPVARPGALALVTYGSPLAILYERMFRGVFGPRGGAMEAAAAASTGWHHLLTLTGPFAFPFWAVDEPAGGLEPDQRRSGWALSRLAPHADTPCPACGWSRAVAVGAPGGSAGAGEERRGEPGGRSTVDYVVTDPDRWRAPLDAQVPRAGGHSTFHDHREVDGHLAHIARRLAG